MAGRGRTSERDERRGRVASKDNLLLLLLKTPEHGGLQVKAGLSPPLPTTMVWWGVTHFLANTKLDTTSVLNVRISLDSVQEKSPSTKDTSLRLLVWARKPTR